MDSDFLKNLEYFTVPNNQTGNPQGGQGGESSSAATARNPNEAAFWEALAGAESGLSAATSSGGPAGQLPSGSYAQSSGGPGAPYRSYTGQTYHGGPKRTLPTRAPPPPQMTSPRRKDAHDKKRQKADPDSSALESVDYWIQFDDDDADNNLGGSFEIDYSKRQHGPSSSFTRYAVMSQ